MRYIGKIDKTKLGKYAEKVVSDEIILTDERNKHIFDDHMNDYEKIISNLDRVALNPTEVLEDCKNKDTVFFIDKLEDNNLNVVIRLNTTNDEKHPNNSIMTAWIINNSKLEKLRKKHKTLYKDE